MDKKYYVPGYSGYIPGNKWKIGSRSSSEPPPGWRNMKMTQENFVTVEQAPRQQRPQSRRQRFQSAKGGRIRSANHFEKIATRPMDTSTQFPVRTTEMATQADVDYDQFDTVNRSIPKDTVVVQETAKIVRPPSRVGQQRLPQLDGRYVNHQRADVLFMPGDPFRGLSSQTTDPRRNARYYEYQKQLQQQKKMQNGNANGAHNGVNFIDGIPTPGYSGFIPGLRSFVGKPYGEAMKTLRDIHDQQKPMQST